MSIYNPMLTPLPEILSPLSNDYLLLRREIIQPSINNFNVAPQFIFFETKVSTLLANAGSLSLLPATFSALGGVIVPANSNLTVDVSGNLSFTTSNLNAVIGNTTPFNFAPGINIPITKTINFGANGNITNSTNGFLVFNASVSLNSNILSFDTGNNVGIVFDGINTLVFSTNTATGYSFSFDNPVILSGNPTSTSNPNQAATKNYVDINFTKATIAGGAAQGSVSLTVYHTQVNSCPANGGVTLSSTILSQRVTNRFSANINVWPATGRNIDGAGVNIPFVLPPNTSTQFDNFGVNGIVAF